MNIQDIILLIILSVCILIAILAIFKGEKNCCYGNCNKCYSCSNCSKSKVPVPHEKSGKFGQAIIKESVSHKKCK